MKQTVLKAAVQKPELSPRQQAQVVDLQVIFDRFDDRLEPINSPTLGNQIAARTGEIRRFVDETGLPMEVYMPVIDVVVTEYIRRAEQDGQGHYSILAKGLRDIFSQG